MTASTASALTSPPEEKPSEDFQLKISGQSVPVYQARVSAIPFNRLWPGHQRPLDQTEIASFAAWDMSAPVIVEIISRRPVHSIAVRPSFRGILPTVEGNRIAFPLATPGPLTVEINGWHFALHLFPSPPEDPASIPSSKGSDVRYFGPGFHKPGEIKLLSNQTVYLAPGAVVQSSIQATGASNIKILGRGILDSSHYHRGTGDPSGCIRLTDCKNVTIEGLILRDPNAWCLTCTGCTDVAISNVKLIGLWRYNADGIDICNCRNVTIRDSFIRSYDDSIVIKGLYDKAGDKTRQSVKNVLVERCVVWCDWGRALEIGAETVAEEIADLIFRDCDIIHTNVAAMDIQHGDRAAVKNVLFENIRLEIDDENGAPIIQKSDDDPYVPDLTWVPRLLIIEIVSTMWNHDKVRGTVDGVTLRNISVTGKPFPPSRLQGIDADHTVKNITLENLRINGSRMTSLEEAAFTIKPFVENVRILETTT